MILQKSKELYVPSAKSLKKDDVTILFDEPDKDNGYYLGSDYYFYKLYNKKYFKVEPVCWHTLESRQTFYCDKIVGYTQFSGYVNEYEKSNLKKVIKEFEKEFNVTIPDDQAEKISTVGDALKYIEENIG